MKLESWELRWFGEGAIPLPLQQWAEENELTTQPVRTDHYLMNSAGSALGIKWREGNLQIKEQHKNQENGSVEHYTKWSFSLDQNDLLQRIEKEQEWLAVTKKRDLAKWRVINGTLERMEPGQEEENGIELEVSAVICQEKLWWTVAFEASGSLKNLKLALKVVNIPIEEKDAERMGYAEWLELNFHDEPEG